MSTKLSLINLSKENPFYAARPWSALDRIFASQHLASLLTRTGIPEIVHATIPVIVSRATMLDETYRDFWYCASYKVSTVEQIRTRVNADNWCEFLNKFPGYTKDSLYDLLGIQSDIEFVDQHVFHESFADYLGSKFIGCHIQSGYTSDKNWLQWFFDQQDYTPLTLEVRKLAIAEMRKLKN